MLDNAITYTALGGSIVALCVWLFRSLVSRAVKRSDSEGSLDDRAVRLVDEVKEQLQDERAEKKRMQEELFRANERFASYVLDQQRQTTEIIEKIRDEHREATRLINGRLDHCERQHAACEASNRELRARVEADAAARSAQPSTIVVNHGAAAAPTPP